MANKLREPLGEVGPAAKTCRHKTKNKSPYLKPEHVKEYEYEYRFLSGVRLEDLADLIGVEAACKLFHFYARTNIFIPSKGQTFKRWQEICIRHEYESLVQNGSTKIGAIRHLGKKFSFSKQSIMKKIGLWDYAYPDKQKKYKKAFTLKVEQGKKLEAFIALHGSILRQYKII